MYCRNCGSPMDPNAVVCVKCGVAKGGGRNYCMNCGAQTAPEAVVCTKCGVALGAPTTAAAASTQKSKVAAGLLGIFLGSLGVHNFYLGYTTKAIIQLCLTIGGILLLIPTFGISAVLGWASGIWGLVEGIMILAGGIKKDGNGLPLKD